MKILAAWPNAKNPDDPLAPQLEAAMAELGHELMSLDNFAFQEALGQQALQDLIREAVAHYQPEVLWLLCPYDELDRCFLDDLRAEGLLILSTSGDDELFHPDYRHDQRLGDWIRLHYQGLDVVGVNSRFMCEEAHRAGLTHFFHVPQAIDPRPFRAVEPVAPLYDVSFVGQAYADRVPLVRHLIANGLEVALFGRGWEQFPDLSPHTHGFVSTEVMKQIFARSRINLSFCMAAGSSGMVHSKARTYEIAACGGFQISTWDPELLASFVEGEEIAFYRDANDLLEQVRFYLARPELTHAIGLASRARVFREHTHAKRLRPLFDQLMALRRSRPLPSAPASPPRLLPLAHLKAGQAKLAAGKATWARAEFLAGLSITPAHPDLLCALARTDALLGDGDSARLRYIAALTAAPFRWSSSRNHPLREAVWWLLNSDLQLDRPESLREVFGPILQDKALADALLEQLERHHKMAWLVELACSVPRPQLLETLTAPSLQRIGIAALETSAPALAADFFRAAQQRCAPCSPSSELLLEAESHTQSETLPELLALPGPSDEWLALGPYVAAFRPGDPVCLTLLYDQATGTDPESLEARLMKSLHDHGLDPEAIPDILVEVTPLTGALVAGRVRQARALLSSGGPWGELALQFAETLRVPRLTRPEPLVLQDLIRSNAQDAP